MDNNYQAGQVVKVSEPETYGVIKRILKRGTLHHDEKETTIEGKVIVIEYQKSLKTLGSIGIPVTESEYHVDDTYFGKAFCVIDPETEISELEKKLADSSSLNPSIESAIEFLRKHSTHTNI